MASAITQPVFLQRDGQAELASAPSYAARSFCFYKDWYLPENWPRCYSNFIHNISEMKRSVKRETCSCCTPQTLQVFFEIFKYTDIIVICCAIWFVQVCWVSTVSINPWNSAVLLKIWFTQNTVLLIILSANITLIKISQHIMPHQFKGVHVSEVLVFEKYPLNGNESETKWLTYNTNWTNQIQIIYSSSCNIRQWQAWIQYIHILQVLCYTIPAVNFGTTISQHDLCTNNYKNKSLKN